MHLEEASMNIERLKRMVGAERSKTAHLEKELAAERGRRLDEAQLIGDPQRGWAWTRALLGLEAHEIHLCGSPAVLPLVRRIAAVTGDDMEERSYERLSPLVVDRAGPFVAPPSAFHRSLSSSS